MPEQATAAWVAEARRLHPLHDPQERCSTCSFLRHIGRLETAIKQLDHDGDDCDAECVCSIGRARALVYGWDDA